VGRLADVAIDAIYSSPSARARETVEPLAAARGVSVCEVGELRERTLGTGWCDFGAAVRATWDDFEFAHPGGESNAAAQRRIVGACDRLMRVHPEGCFVMSTHGNVLALLLRHWDPSVGLEFWSRLTRPDVYRVWVGESGGVRIERLWS